MGHRPEIDRLAGTDKSRKDIAASATRLNYYVSGSGSDTTGDGSVALPFRSIQKAIDIIPNSPETAATVYVWLVGAGPFAGFVVNKEYATSLTIFVVGDTFSAAAFSLNGLPESAYTTPTNPAGGDKYSTYEVATGTHGLTLTEGNYWVWGNIDFDDGGGRVWPEGYCVDARGSTSSTLRVGKYTQAIWQENWYPNSTFEIRSYASKIKSTVYTADYYNWSIFSILNETPEQVSLSLIGLHFEFEAYEVGTFKEVIFFGCKASNTTSTTSIRFYDCGGSVFLDKSLSGSSDASPVKLIHSRLRHSPWYNCIFNCPVQVSGKSFFSYNTIRGKSTGIARSISCIHETSGAVDTGTLSPSLVFFQGNDFETSISNGAPIPITAGHGVQLNLGFRKQNSLEGTDGFLKLSTGALANIDTTYKLTGSCAGIPFIVTTGARVFNAKSQDQLTNSSNPTQFGSVDGTIYSRTELPLVNLIKGTVVD